MGWGEVAFHFRLTFHLCHFLILNSPFCPSCYHLIPPQSFTLVAEIFYIHSRPTLEKPTKKTRFFSTSSSPPSLSLPLSLTQRHAVSSSLTWVFAKGMTSIVFFVLWMSCNIFSVFLDILFQFMAYVSFLILF